MHHYIITCYYVTYDDIIFIKIISQKIMGVDLQIYPLSLNVMQIQGWITMDQDCF
jgi:hypothetical protein